MARVGLVFGGRSVEHLVSVRSARTVREGLLGAGHEVVPLGIAEDGVWLPVAAGEAALAGTARTLTSPGGKLAPSARVLLDAGVDVVFPIVHGTFGEDGALQGLLEMLDVPYVGAGIAASAVAMDKYLAKKLFEAAGLPVVRWWSVRSAAEAAVIDAPAPLFVKPSVGGSSVGCKKVDRREDLAAAIEFALQFDDRVLVEQCVKAREIEVAVLGGAQLEASAVGEIVPGKDFYDYEDKYLKEDAKLLAPAPLDDATTAKVRRLGVEAFAAIGGYGMARVDFFLVGEQLYINEINTLPGFTSVSMYPRLWGLAGLPLPRLCARLVDVALERHAARRRIDDGIRAFVGGFKG
jgi:D-alanine-D-alanine ligase